jgi:hypothetical protein
MGLRFAVYFWIPVQPQPEQHVTEKSPSNTHRLKPFFSYWPKLVISSLKVQLQRELNGTWPSELIKLAQTTQGAQTVR